VRLLQLFGHPLLRTGDSTAPIGVPLKAIALLALLAEDPSRAIARDRLAETLWPDAPLDEALERAPLSAPFE
jgi:DNA-binding SARP family transcriptional activator